MTDSEFQTLLAKTLDVIETACETLLQSTDTDIDAARNGAVLTLCFANASKIILNGQAPLQQIWLAAKAGGYHYAWQNGAWRDTRDGSELLASLARLAQAQAGVTLSF